MSADCEHKRSFDLNTSKHVCEFCGVDWDSLKTKKTLFCAIYMVKVGANWEAGQVYMHHDTIEEARLQFYTSETRVVRQVQIAPVVGFLADDDNADQVSA